MIIKLGASLQCISLSLSSRLLYCLKEESACQREHFILLLEMQIHDSASFVSTRIA